MKLNEQQKLFVEEYMVDWNAAAAARRAGYKQPEVYGLRLKTKLAPYILKRLNMKLEKIELSRDNLAMEMRLQMMRCIGQIPVTVTEKRRLANGEEVWEDVEKKIFDANGFNKASENLAKMYRLMDNKLEINVNKREMGVLLMPSLNKEEKDVTPKPIEIGNTPSPAISFPPLFKEEEKIVSKDEPGTKTD